MTKQRLAVLVIVGALITISSALNLKTMAIMETQSTSPSAPTTTYRGLFLITGRCDLEADFCSDRSSKPWTDQDVATIKLVLDEIAAAPQGATILAVLVADKTPLARYNRASVRLYDPPDQVNAAFYGRAGKQIEIYDRFFEKTALRDRLANYRVQTKILLHEFFHDVDLNGARFSLNGPEFKAVARLDIQLDENDIKSHDTAAERVTYLLGSNDYVGALEVNRRWATSFIKNRLPSMQAWTNLQEAFAEIGSHLLLEPASRQYLRQDVLDYFDQRVMLSLRGTN